MKQRKKIIIVGAGLAGLAAAEKLSSSHDIILIEKEPTIGGLARNFRKNQRYIPYFYHHIIKSNLNTQNYLKKFGNIDLPKKRWTRIKVAIALNNKVYNINNPLKFIKFSYLNLYEKIRFGLFGIYTLFLMNPAKLHNSLDAQTWLEKTAGKRVTKKIWHHLYSRNKFNIPLNQISAKQFAYRLHEKEVYDFFTSPKNGYQAMIDNLDKTIKQNKGIIKTNSEITQIDVKKKIIKINNKEIKYDILINTAPFQDFLKITKNLPLKLKQKLNKIKYCPAVSICFATEKFLNKDHYWINFFNERIHMLMQHSVLNDSYGEKISWCLRYGGSEEDLDLSDEEIKKEYLGVIKKYFPNTKIKWAKVIRTKYGEPIYDIHYQKYMPNYKTEVEGLYFAGIQLTYPKIRNMNVALGSGIKVANMILKELGTKPLKTRNPINT